MISEKSLNILKMLADTRDCSIPWNSTYNIAIREAIEELEKETK